ncbi:STAS domain-containing protein [Nonomuraea sp. bgisy101]|uniref:STAS domain-containing protein n=1 Tax=Nonomuraea sp. bgisy101 TaxID=3413784 RepID=UPI003D741379
MTGLTSTVRGVDSGVVFELAGRLDHHTAPEVRRTLADIPLTAGQLLIIDLSGLTFCDSSGIAAFVAARNHATAADATIAMAAVPAQVARVLRLIGLDRVLSAYPTAQAASEEWTRTAHRHRDHRQ